MKKILMQQNGIPYTIRKSKRARYMRLSVRRDLSVTITMPWRASEYEAIRFLREKWNWVLGKLRQFKKMQSTIGEPSRREYLAHKEAARKIVEEKLAYFNQFYNFTWNKIHIRNPLSRWGSCSEKGNLNFSYRLVFLPEELQDYIVVHELCHLGEFNHSRAFWNLMAKTIPDCRTRCEAIRSL